MPATGDVPAADAVPARPERPELFEAPFPGVCGTSTVPHLVLGPILRHVTSTTATIWVETSSPCTVCVLDCASPTFSVSGHHYALVILEDLPPAEIIVYDVRLDDQLCWPPPGSPFPPSVIRTDGATGDVRVLFGSCRAAAPHEPPYTDTFGSPVAKGVDALRAFAAAMTTRPPAEWPDLMLFLGDQIYADDPSPDARRVMSARRPPDSGLPAHLAGDFEDYTYLYRESWSGDLERWLLSVVPSAMVFDDHDVIDDWNISDSWVADIRREPWWEDHVIGALVSYWVYQHLGNLSPAEIRAEGMLQELLRTDDGHAFLRDWARRSESFTPVPGGYPFSFHRDIGPVRIVIIDTRNGRVLTRGERSILDDDEWGSVVAAAEVPSRHVVLGSSLPAFVPGGLHGVQQWNEALCDGAWGTRVARMSEMLRRALDIEDWPAFDRSFRDLEHLLIGLGSSHRDDAPATISILSGDIHFSYLARLEPQGAEAMTSRLNQVVCSPIRNSLGRKDRRVLAFGISSLGRRIGGRLQRLSGRQPSRLVWDLECGPHFGNSIGELVFRGDEARVVIHHADADGLQSVVEHDL